MPWKDTCPMTERLQFILEYQHDDASLAHLCRAYGISRKSGYKWITRFAEEGVDGLRDRSRAPHQHPNAVAPALEALIVALRREKMHRGPLKLRALLQARDPTVPWPAVSTIAAILKRHGLVVPRRPRPRATPSAQPLAHAGAANDVWCADFKGWFRCGNGQRVDPLTISDAASRYLLLCHGLTGATGVQAVRPLFEATFRAYGLPEAMRTDNGPPFASTGLGGLSRLAVWWMRLGIRLERIRPGKPQDNGRHERLHRTLKSEAITPPAPTPRAQQRAFDAFQRDYNNDRPHQALGLQPPAACYTPAPREWPVRLREPDYSDDWESRMIRTSGCMKWMGREIFVSQALVGERIGLAPVDDGLWRVYFFDQALGLFDERRRNVRPLKRSKPEVP